MTWFLRRSAVYGQRSDGQRMISVAGFGSNSNELAPLLRAAENDGATILPVILKPCRYSRYKKLSAFQAVKDSAKPLSKLTEDEQDEILLALTDRIDELMNPSE